MAKIQFRIREKGTKRAIADATMLMNCTLSDGSKWNSGVQKMTSPGVVWLEIPDKTFKEIDPKTVNYEIVKNGQKLRNKGALPKGNGTGTFQINISVEKASDKPVEPINSNEMKIEIDLIDEKENYLKGAMLRLHLKMKDKSERIVPPQESNHLGQIEPSSMPLSDFKLINFTTSKYQIEFNGLITPWVKLGKPNDISNQLSKWTLIAKKLGEANSNSRSDSGEVLKAILKTAKEDLLVGATAQLSFKSLKNKVYELDKVEADKNGIAEFKLPISGEQIDWQSINGQAYFNDKKYEVAKVGSLDPAGVAWYVNLFMQESSVTEPQSNDHKNVLINIQNHKNEKLNEVLLYGTYQDIKGQNHDIAPLKIDESGVFKWPTDSFPGTAKDRKSVNFLMKYQDQEYKASQRNGPRISKGDAHDYRLDLTIETDVSAPTPDNSDLGWSTGNPEDGWRVEGLITGDGGGPLADIEVKAYDKTVGEEYTFGKAVTGKNGRYRIYYKPRERQLANIDTRDATLDHADYKPEIGEISTDQIIRVRQKSVDLLVRAFNENQQLASSGVISNAGPVEKVDFSLSDETFAGVPLFTQITNDLEEHIGNDSPASLAIEDVALLADKMHQNDVVLAHYVRAWDLLEELNRQTENLLAEGFFALTAGGLHPTLDGVLGATNKVIITMLEEAIASRWISNIDIEEFIKLIDELRAEHFANSDSDLSRLLDAVGVVKSKKGQVIVITLGEETEEEKWNTIQTIIGAAKTNKLRPLIEIWRTLEKDATVTINLYQNNAVRTIENLVVVDYATLLNAAKQGNEMPADMPGKNNDERLKNYVSALLNVVEERHPHQHFLQNLKQSEVDIAQTRANQFLSNTDFDLESPESLRQLAADDSLKDLADLATLYVICPMPNRFIHTEQIMARNLTSSMEINDWSRDKFRKTLKPEMNEAISNSIYDKAAHLGSMTTALSIQLPANDERRKNTLVDQLFADSLNGACEHCTSTFSPSAYLLDLYRFLKKAQLGEKEGTELLDQRRSDIKGLLLNCDNAETLIPYIDLSNEVLEAKVLDQPLTARQTDSSTAQLRAEPEYVNHATYEFLAEQTFPWVMGYDRELDRSRTYLSHLSINLANIAGLIPVDGKTIDAVNQEFSRVFNVANPQVITLGNQAKWLANWGVNNRDLLENRPSNGSGQRNLADLSLWLHMDAMDIVSIAESAFVALPKQTVDSVGEVVYTIDAFGNIEWRQIDNNALIRIQFFGRLFQVTGYSVELLDRIFELDLMDANAPVVWRAELSALQQLADTFKTSVEEIVVLWESDSTTRLTLLADEFGLSLDEYNKLESIAKTNNTKPSGLLKLARLVSDLDHHGFALIDIINLLAVPTSEHAFISQTNDELLTGLKLTIEAEVDSSLHQQVLANTLAQSWGVSNISVSIALSYFDSLLDDVISNTQDENQILLTKLRRLHKSAWLLDLLELNEEQATAVETISSAMAWPQITALPFEESDTKQSLSGLISLAEHQRVNQLYFTEEHDIFKQLSQVGNTRNALVSALSIQDSLWSSENLTFLLGANALNISNKQDFIAKGCFVVLSKLLELVNSTGGSVSQVWNAIAKHDASEAQALLKASLDESSYLETLAQLNDPIRERCRARLVEVVLTQSRNKGRIVGYENSHYLYEDLLIDPEMSACFDTSRTKQAIASLQQLIQRIMLNLEGDWQFNPADIDQWVWRKNYRVWEANRKVFLTPENWVEPELRDNKSALFEELESELLQGDVDSDRAEKTLLNYARGLLSLSRMEMVATLYDEISNRNYVFARSSDHPRRYYWCLRDSNGLWGGWQHIDQEIEGDHVLPVIFHNRVFLFWLNLVEKVDTSNQQYQDKLATLEADEEICRSEISEKNRLIQDYEDKAVEYDKFSDNPYPVAGMGAMWDQLATALREAADDIDEQINGEGGLKDDLISLKSQKEGLARYYSYFECNLSWSQFDGASGWSPAKRSVEGVDTIYKREEEENETHINIGRSFWLLAKPNQIDLDIELRCSAGNSDGKSYDYRLGLFEFDPILEEVSAKDEDEAPKFERKIHFTTIWYNGQKMTSLHLLPVLTIDVDDQDQTLMSWDPDKFGISVYPERLEGYNPSHSPFLMSYKNQSYFIEPEKAALGKPLVNIAAKPRVSPQVTKAQPTVTNSNFQALSISAGSHIIDKQVSPAFVSKSNRQAARPLGRSNGKLADGRPSQKATLNNTPATGRDWSQLEKVIAPANKPAQVAGKLATGQRWQASVLYHPFSEIIVSELYRGGVDALYRPDVESGELNAVALSRQGALDDTFADDLNPSAQLLLSNEKEERFEFNRRNPYSVYNWEIFFHAPFAIAKHLTRNRKFEDAQKWLHYIFDPVSRDGQTNRSNWRFKPFFMEHLRLLDGSQDEITELAEQNFGEFEAQVAEWEQNPFNPHAVARLRTVSYMRSTFIAYVDNILAWADDLFRRDTMESVAEAAQLYIQAAQLLGPAPISLPDSVAQKDSNTLAEHDTNSEKVHPLLVASGIKLPPAKPDKNDFYSKMGNFCIPANDRIQEYWDTVADRLFKIRHCMNIEGVERTLALYQPPIDPAMLVRAAAAGVDLGAVIGGLNSSLPHYRFSYVLQKAKEFAAEVRSLGGALLSALEKRDSETLSQLRSDHETTMQKRILAIKKERLNETKNAHASLEKSLFAAMDRRDHYQELLDQGPLNQEKEEVKKVEGANKLSSAADVANVTGAVLAVVPQTGFNGPMPTFKWGGLNLSSAAGAIGSGLNARSGGLNRQAGMLARDASLVRRNMDWDFQIAQAKRDIERIHKDQVASEIRLAINEKEIADQELQIAQSEEADLFLRDKFTNEELYGWMVGELSALHYQAYKLALDIAKQAEACMNFELDQAPANIIEFTYWDGMKKGLLSGEKLVHDLSRLDTHFIANNDRKLELTKNISLIRLDANKLLDLKRDDAECTFTIPEYIFDLDYPGHYKRRIKSVSLTIPAISGPYTTLSCELDLQSSRIVNEPGESAEDSGKLSDSVALSSGQNDSGLFQFDLRDERYLPFEGHGVDSTWKIALPAKSIAQFDYSSIADVILTINYTAKNDTDKRSTRTDEMEAADFGQAEFTQLLSLKGQFSDLWHQLVSTTDSGLNNSIALTFISNHFPYVAAARGVTINSFHFATVNKKGLVSANTNSIDVTNGGLESGQVNFTVSESWALDLLRDSKNLKDIYVLVNYTIGVPSQ